MAHLFGTDGVRGKAGEFPLDVATIRRLGAALVRALRHDGAASTALRFLAGRDTRESGAWIERELAYGIQSQGGSYTSTGVVPTPAIAYLTPRLGYSAGVVISASHNPFEDNGIKVFSGAGEKFPEPLERHDEFLYRPGRGARNAPRRVGDNRLDVPLERFGEFLAGAREHLDAVVLEGIVRSRDHDTR